MLATAVILFVVLNGNATAVNVDSDLLGDQSKTSPAPLKSTTSIAASILPSVNSAAQTSIESTDAKLAVNKMEQDDAIYEHWKRNNALLGSAVNDLDSYDLETLKQLAFNGNEKAVSKAGYLYQGEQGVEAAINFYQEAAIRGSINALAELSLVAKATGYDHVTDPAEKKKFAINILAFNEVAAMRGNRLYKIVFNKTQFEKDNIFISEADEAMANKLAQNIYDDLQKKRDALGLGSFDNSVPETVTRRLDGLESVLKKAK